MALRSHADSAGWRPAIGRPLTALRLLLVLAVFFSAAIANAQTSTTLVTNTGQVNTDDEFGFDHDLALSFTTGASSAGYKLTSVDVVARIRVPQAARPHSFTVSVRTLVAGQPIKNSVGTAVGWLDSPTLTNGTNSFTSSAGIDLDPDTSYYLVLDITGEGNRAPKLDATLSNAEDSGGAAGWTIANQMIAKSRTKQLPGSRSWVLGDWYTLPDPAVIEVNFKGYAKSIDTGTSSPPPETPETPETPATDDHSEIVTVEGGEPGASYTLSYVADGEVHEEERTISDEGTYQVRRCEIYNWQGVKVMTIFGGTGPCPERGSPDVPQDLYCHDPYNPGVSASSRDENCTLR